MHHPASQVDVDHLKRSITRMAQDGATLLNLIVVALFAVIAVGVIAHERAWTADAKDAMFMFMVAAAASLGRYTFEGRATNRVLEDISDHEHLALIADAMKAQPALRRSAYTVRLLAASLTGAPPR
jgi:hypothetical protein